MRTYFVYILANKRSGTLYTGVTGNLKRRIIQHKQGLHDCFTRKYYVNRLVYFERYSDVMACIHREKQLKGWHRKWKMELIEKMNPNWVDLFYRYCPEYVNQKGEIEIVGKSETPGPRIKSGVTKARTADRGPG